MRNRFHTVDDPFYVDMYYVFSGIALNESLWFAVTLERCTRAVDDHCTIQEAYERIVDEMDREYD